LSPTRRSCPIVDAERAGAECRDLQKPTRHHHVLEEVDHLVLIGEIAVKRHRRCEREQGQSCGHVPNAIAGDEKQTAAEFNRTATAKASGGKGNPTAPIIPVVAL
jgi:hypothetical protein